MYVEAMYVEAMYPVTTFGPRNNVEARSSSLGKIFPGMSNFFPGWKTYFLQANVTDPLSFQMIKPSKSDGRKKVKWQCPQEVYKLVRSFLTCLYYRKAEGEQVIE